MNSLDVRPTIQDAGYWTRLDAATAHLDAPVAVLDRTAARANAAELIRRAGGLPVRIASKSIRVREVLRELAQLPGVRGLLCYSLVEAIWLAADHDDLLVGYPSIERNALRRLATDESLAGKITVMIDSPAQLDFIDSVVPPRARPSIRVCLDLDAALMVGGLRLGVWRSMLRTPEQARRAARLVLERPGFELVGLLAYEAQVAGLGDRPSGGPVRRGHAAVLHRVQELSRRDLLLRRGELVRAVAELTELEFVNGGGTGSLEFTASDPAITEVSAGSGVFGPALFDNFRHFRPAPAAMFCLAVGRKPRADIATLTGGGWVASGRPGVDRFPVPCHPEGLSYVPAEMGGEVQTPLRGADGLAVGDRVWFRHAKAGELSEHVNAFQVFEPDGTLSASWPTYRGEGRAIL